MKDDYLVQKKPLYALLVFALPIIIGNLFQQTYTMADTAIVGRFVSEKALAAVGASYSLTNIFICIALGGGIGASVIVSKHFGAGQYPRLKLAVRTSLVAFLLASLVLAGLGLALSRSIMVALNTPADVLDMAVEYLQIYFLGLPFLFLYNVLSCMFNALGKSRIPLYFLIFSSVFNVALDFVLVTRYGMGVAGVAFATLVAQGISAVLSFVVLLRVLRGLPSGRVKGFDRRELLAVGRVALPSILQQSTVSIGMMLVQSVVNGFGSEALAGFSAAMRVEAICLVPLMGIGTALSSYTAQNIGAGRQQRVVQGYRVANWAILACSVALCVLLQCFKGAVIGLFLGEAGTAVAVATGTGYVTFISWFFCVFGFKNAVDSLLRGAGDMKMFTVANLANLFVRVSVAFLLAPRFGIAMVWYAVPIGWFVNWAVSFLQYRTGKWRFALDGTPRKVKA